MLEEKLKTIDNQLPHPDGVRKLRFLGQVLLLPMPQFIQ